MSLAGQSAIEYLMTYGWMLLVVAIVGGAIFSMVGEQNIESVTGFAGQDITVTEFGTTSSSLQMNVQSNIESIELRQVKISDSSGERISVPLNYEISAQDSQVLNIPHLKVSESQTEFDIELVYDTGSLENITSKGTLTGNLEVDDSLAGYWDLSQEQSNATHVFDVSGNEAHGSLEGAEIVEENDKKFAKFNGSSYIRVPHNEVLAIDREATYSIWMYIEGDTGDHQHPIIKPQSSYDYNIRIQGDYDRLDYYTSAVNAGAPSANWGVDISTIDQEWRHVLARHTGDQLELWLDGDLKATRDLSEDERLVSTSSTPLDIGYQFNGSMSNLQIYNRSVSDREVRALASGEGLVR